MILEALSECIYTRKRITDEFKNEVNHITDEKKKFANAEEFLERSLSVDG